MVLKPPITSTGTAFLRIGSCKLYRCLFYSLVETPQLSEAGACRESSNHMDVRTMGQGSTEFLLIGQTPGAAKTRQSPPKSPGLWRNTHV